MRESRSARSLPRFRWRRSLSLRRWDEFERGRHQKSQIQYSGEDAMTRKTTGSISRRRLLTTASAGAALAASPFRINLLQAQEATIKIGFPVPLTGPYGAEAQDQVRAAQVAIAQFNEGGGLNGRKAELIVRDDKL